MRICCLKDVKERGVDYETAYPLLRMASGMQIQRVRDEENFSSGNMRSPSLKKTAVHVSMDGCF